MLKKLFIFIFGIVLLSSCEQKAQIPFNKVQQEDTLSQEILKLNQLIADVEAKEIRHYVDTSKLNFEASENGFWIAVLAKGSGEKIINGDAVNITSQMESLAGEVYYATSQKQLAVGKMRFERGFQDALQTLREGDEAIVIVPSNQSFGVLGDRNKIPPRAVLVYRINGIEKLKN